MTLKKRIAYISVIAVVCALTVVSIGFYRAFHKFSVEDQIHGAFFPVVAALYDYEHDHSTPATNLMQLVPAYIAQIPRSHLVDSVEYSVIDDGKTWQLNLYSHALSKPRIYCCRSSQKFSAEEERKVVLRYHGVWTVIRE